MFRLIFFFALLLSFAACNNKEKSTIQQAVPAKTIANDQFGKYWYAGKAEVNAYNLKQARYGEIRDGKAVLIFVTEPFSKSKQVKLDRPEQAGDDKLTVMKLNFVKKFNTGIYPYSMMLSSFTPVDQYHFPNTEKVTMTSQEWCGHVFTQLNLANNKYRVHTYSYFESEGDQDFKIDKSLLEDEIWNLIRLDYESLPVGEIEIVPGIFSVRLNHKSLQPLKVQASMEEQADSVTYMLRYPNERTLSINFEKQFPHKILSWKETTKSPGGEAQTTAAVLDKTLYTDYWNKNGTKFSYLRDSLNLPQ